MAIDRTRVLGLTLGPDAQVNRNWEMIDEVLRRLTKQSIVPTDLEVLGDLHVTGTTTLDGPVTCPAGITGGAGTFDPLTSLSTLDVAGLSTLAGGLRVDGPAVFTGGVTVDPPGPVTLPPGAIDGSALAPGAAVQTVGVSVPMTGAITLGDTPVELNRLTLDAAEELGRWELIVVSGTLRYANAANATSVTVTLELRRGPAVQQVRQFFFSSAAAIAPTVDVPFSLFRVTQPPDLTHEWSCWGSRAISAPGPQAEVHFAQVAAVQLR